MSFRERRVRAPRPPLTARQLDELALAYVGRFATSRAKLAAYLARKLKERGFEGEGAPDPAAVAERMAALGYLDDAAFALARARSLGRRGLGERRVVDALRAAGIGEADGASARDHAHAERAAAALRFARRRRLGPFALAGAAEGDPAARRKAADKALGAMLRAGHPMGLARAVLALEADAALADEEALVDRLLGEA